MENHRDLFWDRIKDISTGMLGLGNDAMLPMTPRVRDDVKDGKIWFMTAAGVRFYEEAKAAPTEARLVVMDRSAAIYADIKGTLTVSEDKAVLDEIWTGMAGAWFEDGKQDDDLRLLCFTPHSADLTLTEDNPLKFFYEVAKAKMTDEQPDAGWQGQITF